MGGQAFLNARAAGHPTLNTRRMSPEDYEQLKARCTTLLAEQLPSARITCPAEAPEKKDHGDVDFVICAQHRLDLIDVAKHLNARGFIDRGSSSQFQLCSLAVCLDGQREEDSDLTKYVPIQGSPKQSPLPEVTETVYAQIDLHVVFERSQYEWIVFSSSYSGIAVYIGHMAKNLGFTVDENGLNLRLQQFDDAKRLPYFNMDAKRGLVFLDRDPQKIMQFLGLSVNEYELGFNSLEDFYKWLGKCRLLHPLALLRRASWKPHRRERESKRPIFSQFFDEWVPANFSHVADEDRQADLLSEENIAERLSQLRIVYAQQARDHFSVHMEFDETEVLFEYELDVQTTRFLLRPIVREVTGLDDKHITRVLKALDRHLEVTEKGLSLDRRGHSKGGCHLHRLLDFSRQGLQDECEVRGWLVAHWEEALALEAVRERMRSTTIE